MNSTINVNSGAHTLTHHKIIKSPFNNDNVVTIQNKWSSNKDLYFKSADGTESPASFIRSTKISLRLAYIIPTTNTHYTFRKSDKIPYFKTKHSFFKNDFFPSVIIEWNKLDLSLRRCDSYNVFQSNILKFVRPSSNLSFNCHNSIVIKYITRIRLGLSHLREHKFKHSLQDTLNPICNCVNDVKSGIHFFLHCPCIVMNVAHSWTA